MSVAHTLLREQELSTGSAAIRFAFKQMMMGVWGPCPGIVELYDPATRRARVKPALRAVLEDGTTVSRQPIANVPVLSNSNGRVVVTLDLQPGDPVLLLFAQRGIGEFKKTYEEADPVLSGFFSASDAVAIAGFGPPVESADFAPASMEDHGFAAGMSIQSLDGETHVSLDDGCIRLRAPGDAQVDLENGEIRMKAPDIKAEIDGTEYTLRRRTIGGVEVGVFD